MNGTGPINPTWYIGKPQDTTTGIVYFGARWFDPITGRFLGFDPAGVTDENPHSFNRYAYGNNNPYKYLDPDGRESDLAQHSPAPQTAASAWSQAAKAMSNAVAEFGKAWMNASATFFGLVGGGAPLAAGKAAVVAEPVVVVGKKSAQNVANAGRLGEQLTKESAKSPFTASGQLSKEAIAESKMIIKPGELQNKAIPPNMGKFSTQTFQSKSGDFQVHFYKDPVTGQTFYGLDYKAIFNAMSGAK